MATLLIHTGGTIGMVPTKSGFAPGEGVVEGFVRNLVDPPANIDIHTLDRLIDSANATPADWDKIGRVIFDHHDRYNGFVITHGTDTLAYTAAALCFALEGLERPVILTGSMLPLTVQGNDGQRNLHDALRLAGSSVPGVWVQFAGRVLHGARVRKSHSLNLDGFAAGPSDQPPRLSGNALRYNTPGSPKVAVVAVAPGMSDAVVEFAAQNCDGLVLRCYGSGTAPETDGFRRALQTAQRRRIPVVAVSQCPEGGLALGTYAAGAVLTKHGVVDGRDMTVEAAYAKLVYTLAHTSDPAERRDRLGRSLCGELTPERW